MQNGRKKAEIFTAPLQDFVSAAQSVRVTVTV